MQLHVKREIGFMIWYGVKYDLFCDDGTFII